MEEKLKPTIMSVKILSTDQLLNKYSSLVNITRSEQQEMEFQVIKFELQWRAEL